MPKVTINVNSLATLDAALRGAMEQLATQDRLTDLVLFAILVEMRTQSAMLAAGEEAADLRKDVLAEFSAAV